MLPNGKCRYRRRKEQRPGNSEGNGVRASGVEKETGHGNADDGSHGVEEKGNPPDSPQGMQAINIGRQ